MKHLWSGQAMWNSHISNRRPSIQFTTATEPQINRPLLDVHFTKEAINAGQGLYRNCCTVLWLRVRSYHVHVSNGQI